MRAPLERFARRLWSGDDGPALRAARVLLTPASWLWGAASGVRTRGLSRREPERVPGLAVVSVGNLAVGGTGKTPLASWIVRACRAAGVRPVLLLRGYGGDEELLHARWTPEVPVLVGRDRAATARRARAGGACVAVLDDGFQHRRLHRDLDLVLLAVEDPFPGDLLPKGPYREGPSALARAHAVVLTRRSGTERDAGALAARVEESFPGLVTAAVCLGGGRWLDLAGAPADAPTGDVLAAAGVGRPAAFAAAVEGLLGRRVDLLSFADHHGFTRADARRMRARAGGRVLVVTEKDAVKLAPHVDALGPARVLAQDVAFDWGEDALMRLVESAVREGCA